MKKNKPTTSDYIKNILAAITVSFVALSLGAAFGILSGRGAFSGMISASLIAILASLFGGTRIQCSGPTGPMTAVTAVMVAFAFQPTAELYGMDPDIFINISILLSGLLLIIFGLLRLGRFIKLIPNVVISGFMSGIAIIIWLDQLKKLFGFGGKEPFSGDISQNIFLAFGAMFLVFFLPQFFRKIMPKIASYISATFVSIVAMSFFAHFAGFDVELVKISGSIKNISDVYELFLVNIPHGLNWQVLLIALPFALQLAVLAYLDTLMTSLVIDKMTKEKTKSNKELIAQGVANGTVSLLGGIPGAQATIRSVLLVKERATMRLAGVLVGVFALLEMILLQDAISMIPQAVFSGILLKVGYDVFDWLPLRLYVKEIFKKGNHLFGQFFSRHDDEKIFVTNMEMFIILGTALLTVFWDLNFAVAIFTVAFYLHNKVWFRACPMRDLKPVSETEGFADED